MKTKLLVSIAFFVLAFQSVGAQELSSGRQLISGTIRDEGTGNPVSNISVFFEGTLNGTVSESAGPILSFWKEVI